MLLRLDGLPVWSPVHGGGALSTITPDVIGALALDDGAMTAHDGGWLAGVLDAHTRESDLRAPTASITLGPAATRASWGAPLQLGALSGGAIVGVRRSTDGMFEDRSDPLAQLDRWSDGIGSISLASARSSIRITAVASSDHVRATSSAYAAGDPDAGSEMGAAQSPSAPNVAGAQIPAPIATDSATARLTSPWHTQTIGATWTRYIAPSRVIETRAWDARFDALVSNATGATSAATSLASTARQTGVSSELRDDASTIGVMVEKLGTSYDVTAPPLASQPAPANASRFGSDHMMIAGPTPLALSAAPVIITAYGERRFQSDGGAVVTTAGLRGAELTGAHLEWDPRLSVVARLSDAVTWNAGVARMHQFVQSLTNPFSPLSGIIGAEFPLAAGDGGIPVASADMLTSGFSARLGAHTVASLDGYERRFANVVAPDDGSGALFPIRDIHTTSGRAAGLAAAASGSTGPLAWQVGYRLGVTSFYGVEAAHDPGSRNVAQDANGSLAFHVRDATQLRLTAWGGNGGLPTDFDGASMMDVFRNHVGSDDAASSRIDHDARAVTPDQYRVPPYMRVDLGAEHEWRVSSNADVVTMSLTLANVFNRANLAGYVPVQGLASTAGLSPRALLIGLGWRR